MESLENNKEEEFSNIIIISLSNPLIFTKICTFLEIKTVLVLMRCSKEFFQMINQYFKHILIKNNLINDNSKNMNYNTVYR